MDKYVGKRLDGRYEIQEVIGVGGMAVVYRAYDNVEDRTVAIKILKEEFSTNEEFLRRFKNESKVIAMLSHQNIVKVYDVSFGDLLQYIVMEYIDGITLKQYIEKEGSLPWKDAVHLIIQVLRGLQHAHDRGIVHRDVKPQNIMVLRDGTIKVTDFGIARFARSEQKTITDKAIGSVHYISPEQARGETTDEKSDVYSVGVILYEMLTGQLPFQAESAVSVAVMQLQREPSLPSEINGSIPLGLEQITMHAMQKDAGRRYKSAAEMLCDLDAFRKDPAVTFDYNCFVDDAPTKFITDAQEQFEDSDDDETEEKSPIIPILAGVAGAFVVAVIVLLCIFIPKLMGGTGDAIDCPNFVGMTYEEVQKSEYYDKFDVVIKWDYDSESEYGIIFKQNPDAENKKVKEGATIVVYASEGEKTVKVSDVYGLSESMAMSTLKAAGFKPVVVEMTDENVDAGNVIRTSPARGTSLYSGAEVTVYVSTGAPTVYVDLPSVEKMDEEDAVKLIKNAGLTPVTESIESDKPKGVVVKQSPSASDTKQVGKGSVVTIYVSTGVVTYESELTIDLPDDYKFSTAKVSLWIENGSKQLMESDKLDMTKRKQETFKIKSTKATLDILVKLTSDDDDNKSYNYMEIRVDTATGNFDVLKDNYNYPKKSQDTSSHTSSGDTASNGSSSSNTAADD